MKASKGMIVRAKKSLIGRGLCKLAGDQTGAVMMEYVIVAVLIAAACVVAVALFGKTIKTQFSTAAKAVAGQDRDAQTQQQKSEGMAGKTDTEGTEHANKFLQSNKE